MKKVTAIACALLCQGTGSHAESRTKTAPGGQTTRMTTYTAWDPQYYGSLHGVVKVLTKPQHRQLSNCSTSTTNDFRNL